MKLKVSFNNSAGELDSRIVSHTDEDRAAMLAVDAAKEILKDCGGLYPGDSIKSEEVP